MRESEEHALQELDKFLYMDLDLFPSFVETVKALKKSIKTLKYDSRKAVRAWESWITQGARLYGETYLDDPSGWDTYFPKKVRHELAIRTAFEEFGKIVSGKYNKKPYE